jgi:uncharacterized membrane protein YfhO
MTSVVSQLIVFLLVTRGHSIGFFALYNLSSVYQRQGAVARDEDPGLNDSGFCHIPSGFRPPKIFRYDPHTLNWRTQLLPVTKTAMQAYLSKWKKAFTSATFPLVFMLIGGNLLIYKNYIAGDRYLLFHDWGSDSIHQMLPFIHYFTSKLDTSHLWVHGSVLGNNIFTFPTLCSSLDPVLHLIFLSSSIHDIPGRFVYYAMLKSTMGGLFFYFFLRRLLLSPQVAVMGALSYAFCGAFTANSTWTVFLVPSLLSSLSFVLWAFKVWQQDDKWYLFSLSIFYFTLSTQPIVTLYQLSVFGCFYILFDHLQMYRNIDHRGLRDLGIMFLKVAFNAGIGVCLASFVLLPHFYYFLFENVRISKHALSLLAMPQVKELLSIPVRMFSNDFFGTANAWSGHYGYLNYFELPFLYCGILIVISILSAFTVSFLAKTNRRHVRPAAILLSLLILGLVFPGVRAYMYYGGQAFYFRWMSAFAIAGLVIVGSQSLEYLLSFPLSRGRKTLLITVCLGIIASVCSFHASPWIKGLPSPDPFVSMVIVACAAGYALIFYFCRFSAVKQLLLIVLFSELILQGYWTVSHDRYPISRGEDPSQTYANRSVLTALELLRSSDVTRFYRISKTPEYGYCTDNSSLSQAYYGTRGYMSLNTKATVEFFSRLDIKNECVNAKLYLPGFLGRHFLDNLVGVRYYLKRGKLPIPQWAVKIRQVGETEIYMNPLSFPLGTIYDQYLHEEEFDSMHLSAEAKDRVLMAAAVLPTDAKIPMGQILNHLSDVAPISRDENIAQSIRARQTEAFEIGHFGNDVITGRIASTRGGILFFSIPFDPGWHIYIDKNEATKIKVNIGFMGAFLTPGPHTIKLQYFPPYYSIGKILSITALGFFGLGLFGQWRKRGSAETLISKSLSMVGKDQNDLGREADTP